MHPVATYLIVQILVRRVQHGRRSSVQEREIVLSLDHQQGIRGGGQAMVGFQGDAVLLNQQTVDGAPGKL